MTDSADLIPTTPIPSALDAARHALAGGLDADPAPGDFDPARLTVAEALAVLSDVTPPYPPLPRSLDPLVREDRILERLDAWPNELFAPRELDGRSTPSPTPTTTRP
jgi:hypothetical protein